MPDETTTATETAPTVETFDAAEVAPSTFYANIATLEPVETVHYETEDAMEAALFKLLGRSDVAAADVPAIWSGIVGVFHQHQALLNPAPPAPVAVVEAPKPKRKRNMNPNSLPAWPKDLGRKDYTAYKDAEEAAGRVALAPRAYKAFLDGGSVAPTDPTLPGVEIGPEAAPLTALVEESPEATGKGKKQVKEAVPA